MSNTITFTNPTNGTILFYGRETEKTITLLAGHEYPVIRKRCRALNDTGFDMAEAVRYVDEIVVKSRRGCEVMVYVK